MNVKRLNLCFLGTAAFVFGVGFCANALAGYSLGGAFRSPGYGARAWGMGGAGVATVADESAVFWNPAMMALLPSNLAGASYINLVAGATAHQSQLAYAHVLQTSDADDVRGRVAAHSVGALYTNLWLEIQGGASYSENILRVAYSYAPDYFVSFAAAGDLLISSSEVPGFSAVGSSVDAALRLALLEDVTLGFVARNAFSRYSYDDGLDFSREREFAFGVSATYVPQVTIEGDIVFAHGSLSRAIIGGETDYLFDLLALRAGFAVLRSGMTRHVPYFGAGFRLSRLTLHYNANLDDEIAFENTHRFSLSLSL